MNKTDCKLSNDDLKELLAQKTGAAWEYNLEFHKSGYCNTSSSSYWLCFNCLEADKNDISGFDFVIFSNSGNKLDEKYAEFLKSINWYDILNRSVKKPNPKNECALYGTFCKTLKKYISAEFKKNQKPNAEEKKVVENKKER